MPMQISRPLFSFVIILFLCQSLHAQKDKGFNFPPDFGKAETIVLVGEGTRDKITRAMMEAFEKEYTGKFEAEAALDSKRKSDNLTYRYVFVVTEDTQPAQFIGRERFPATTNYRFGLVDRQTGKTHYTEFLSGGYVKGAKYYVKNLEKFRKESLGK